MLECNGPKGPFFQDKETSAAKWAAHYAHFLQIRALQASAAQNACVHFLQISGLAGKRHKVGTALRPKRPTMCYFFEISFVDG